MYNDYDDSYRSLGDVDPHAVGVTGSEAVDYWITGQRYHNNDRS